MVFLVLDWAGLMPSRSPSFPIAILTGGLVGTLCGGLWLRRSKFGVDRKLLENQRRWLISGETVLILQSTLETMRIRRRVRKIADTSGW